MTPMIPSASGARSDAYDAIERPGNGASALWLSTPDGFAQARGLAGRKKLVYRLYRELGLQMRTRRRRKLASAQRRDDSGSHEAQ